MKRFKAFLSPVTRTRQRRNIQVVVMMTGALLVMIVVYSAIFRYLMALEDRSFGWLSAAYWAVTTMSTLGFGDIVFESDLGRLFSVVVLLSGLMFLLILLPFSFIQFVFAPWMDQREASRAPRRVSEDMADHVVITRLDPVTQALIARAERAEVPYVVIVEDAEGATQLNDQDCLAMVGPLDALDTYRNAGIERAAMVVSTQSDTTNTNVAFTVREIDTRITIVVTADKQASVDVLELAGADHVIQLAETLGNEMANRTLGTTGRPHVIGQFDQTLIAEAGARGTELVGLSLQEAGLSTLHGVRVLAVSEHGRTEGPRPDREIGEETMLILAGSKEQLAGYHRQFGVAYHQAESPVLVLGGGRVGRAAARTFAGSGVPSTIVEQIPGRTPDHFDVVHGDAAELETLQAAGLERVSAVLITTHEDDMNVYLTLYCRRLRPNVQIIARATHERNVSTLYRAGADGVLSYATIGATTIWNDLSAERHRVVVSEGVELFLMPVPATLVGCHLRDDEVHKLTGCHIVAVTDEKGKIKADVIVIPDDSASRLMMMGNRHGEREFRKQYLKGHPAGRGRLPAATPRSIDERRPEVQIAAGGLVREFRGNVGVREVDLDVVHGEIHALVGLNGAGKTTLMRLLLGMLRPDSGTALIRGVDVSRASPEIWARVGHLVEQPFGYPELNVHRNLTLAARLRGIPSKLIPGTVERALSALDLHRYARVRASRLSQGNRQRLGLACALQHDPTVLVLDEPTNGLDPAGVIRLRRILLDRASAGAAILVSSHHLDEVARVADRITVLNQGRVIGSIDPRGVDIERTFFELVYMDDEQRAAG